MKFTKQSNFSSARVDCSRVYSTPTEFTVDSCMISLVLNYCVNEPMGVNIPIQAADISNHISANNYVSLPVMGENVIAGIDRAYFFAEIMLRNISRRRNFIVNPLAFVPRFPVHHVLAKAIKTYSVLSCQHSCWIVGHQSDYRNG